MPLRLVLIEDHQALREGLELLLGREGIEVLGTAGTADEGRELVERLEPGRRADRHPRSARSPGIELTAQLIDADPERRIVLYTGSNEIELLISGPGLRRARLRAQGGHAERAARPRCTTVAEGGTYVDPRLHPALLSRRATQTQKSLSKREREIMDLLAQGLTGEQVAERLFLSPETIKTHIRNAMNKLEANTRVHAIAIALREGFISAPTGLVSDDDLVLDGETPPQAAPRPAHAADDRRRLRRGAGRRPRDLRRRPARVRHPHPGRGRGDPQADRRAARGARRLELAADDQQVLDRHAAGPPAGPVFQRSRERERARGRAARGRSSSRLA